MAGSWLRWGLLLWAGLLTASAQGRVRRITYVVRPGPGLAAGALPLGGPPRLRTFNVALNARYSRSSVAAGPPSRASPGVPSERTRRTSQPGGAALQGLRPPAPPPEPARPGGSGGQLHPKPGGHPAAVQFSKQGRQVVRSKVSRETQSSGGSRLQVHQKQQLQGVNVCGGQCCHGWSKAPGSQRCTKRCLRIWGPKDVLEDPEMLSKESIQIRRNRHVASCFSSSPCVRACCRGEDTPEVFTNRMEKIPTPVSVTSYSLQ